MLAAEVAVRVLIVEDEEVLADPSLAVCGARAWPSTSPSTGRPASNGPGEGAWVQVQSGLTDGAAVVRVTNSGPVVPPDQVETLFEPFRRLAPDRTSSQRGVGLGLSIVRAVALTHDGTVHVTAPPSGLDVEVRIPAAPSPAP